MSVATEIQRLNTAKADIKAAIEAKGVTVPSNATIDTYDDYVSQISGGGGGGSSADTEALKGMIDRNITGITIPSGVTSIGLYAFASCDNLKRLNSDIDGVFNIPSGVTSIGIHAFDGCIRMTSVDIPSGVTSIGGHAFRSCWNLTDIVIPSGVTSVGEYTFYLCYALSSVTIPDSVTSIGGSAFSGCRSLTSIEIPSGVTSIGTYAFSNASGLTSITINATTPPTLSNVNTFNNTNNCPIYVPCGSVDTYKAASKWSDLSSRITCAQPSFQGKWLATYQDSHTESAQCDASSSITYGDITSTNLVSVEIGDCVTSIGEGAFYSCTSLSSVTIPDSVTSISEWAFGDCSSLTSCTFGSGVTSIDNWAFYRCSGLTSIDIPSGVTSIGNQTFNYCSSLTSITVNATTPPTLGIGAFDGSYPIYVPASSVSAYQSAWSEYEYRIQVIPTFQGKWLATYTGGTTSSAECDSTSAITESEINLTNLVSVEIGDCVTSIGQGAFASCTSLTSVTIPDSVTSIGEGAFSECSSLTSIDIPNSVTSIGDYVFIVCSSLTSCTIGSDVTSIGNSAFFYCNSLTSITVNATTPPTLGGSVFDNTNNCPIYVPSGSVEAYKEAAHWRDYASRIQAIPNS